MLHLDFIVLILTSSTFNQPHELDFGRVSPFKPADTDTYMEFLVQEVDPVRRKCPGWVICHSTCHAPPPTTSTRPPAPPLPTATLALVHQVGEKQSRELMISGSPTAARVRSGSWLKPSCSVAWLGVEGHVLGALWSQLISLGRVGRFYCLLFLFEHLERS